MKATEILQDAASRPLEMATIVLADLPAELANHCPTDATGTPHNSITWLVWHAARQCDIQLHWATGRPQALSSFADAAALPQRGAEAFGFGDTPEQMAAVVVDDPAVLLAYYRAVHAALDSVLAEITDEELDRIVDESFDPPVSLGVRVVSMIDDAAQHLGQALYVRGLLQPEFSLGV